MQTHQFSNHCTRTHNLPQWEGWDCLSLQSLSILGVIGDRQTLKSSSTLSRALYFVFIAIMAEKDVSQRYVVGKGSIFSWPEEQPPCTPFQLWAKFCWALLIKSHPESTITGQFPKVSSSAFPLRPLAITSQGKGSRTQSYFSMSMSVK